MDQKLQFCSLRQSGWVHWEKKTRKLFVKNQIFQCLLFHRNLVFFTSQLVIEKHLSEIGMKEFCNMRSCFVVKSHIKESSIQIRSLHGPVDYVQNTAQRHTLHFPLSIRLPSGTNIYLIRLVPELLRERSMTQSKPTRAAKSLEGP